MSDEVTSTRPALPRDSFRTQRTLGVAAVSAEPVVVMPAYDDPVATTPATLPPPAPQLSPEIVAPRRQRSRRAAEPRNPFEAYGERSSSRPYALRLPDAIDLVIRQMAAEERTQPLRIVDRILHDHLKRIGRLPPQQGA